MKKTLKRIFMYYWDLGPLWRVLLVFFGFFAPLGLPIMVVMERFRRRKAYIAIVLSLVIPGIVYLFPFEDWVVVMANNTVIFYRLIVFCVRLISRYFVFMNRSKDIVAIKKETI